jgi:hypothetical protein
MNTHRIDGRSSFTDTRNHRVVVVDHRGMMND